MSLKNLKVQKDAEQAGDVLGGGSQPLETGIYAGKVKLAFIKESQHGAMGIELHVEMDNGYIHRETMWVTTRNGDNFYERDGKKHHLPSFTTMDNLAAVTNEVHLADLDTETKVVKLYDFEAQAEKPKEVEMIVDLVGKEAKFAIRKEIDYKNVKDSDGVYKPSDETFTANTIVKVFNTDGFTVLELMNNVEEPDFIHQWEEKNKGNTYDKTRNKKPVITSNNSNNSSPKSTKSLFKK